MPEKNQIILQVFPRWMDYRTAGLYMSVGERTIRRLVDDGVLPFSKIRSMRFLDRLKIDSMMEKKQVKL